MNFTFNAYYTLIAAVIVLLIGKFLVNKIEFLRKYNIRGIDKIIGLILFKYR
jgi:ESS family glutamate:Na+ symporter